MPNFALICQTQKTGTHEFVQIQGIVKTGTRELEQIHASPKTGTHVFVLIRQTQKKRNMN